MVKKSAAIEWVNARKLKRLFELLKAMLTEPICITCGGAMQEISVRSIEALIRFLC